MATKKGISKTKAKVSDVINQAKASLKLFEGLEKEVLAKAKNLAKDAKAQASSEKIAATLQKMGMATNDELEKLVARVEELEAEVAKLKAHEHPHEH